MFEAKSVPRKRLHLAEALFPQEKYLRHFSLLLHSMNIASP
jgi:hypothetical protein